MWGNATLWLATMTVLPSAVPARVAAETYPGPSPWTILIYGGVDSSAESYLMPHLDALKRASRGELAAEIVLLIDRVAGASSDKKILGADFHDTRLFRLDRGRWERVAGGLEFPEITLSSTFEANTGDPTTLRKFIRFAKHQFPARRYVLILFGHGESRSVCPDISSECANSGEFEDPLFTAEITEGLTAEDSVDVLWVDVCSFGGIENAYQFRPRPDEFHARVMLASASVSTPAPIARVLRECGIIRDGHDDVPLVRSATEFGKAALGSIADSLGERKPPKQRAERESWACYDLSKAEEVKRTVDRLAMAIVDGNGRHMVEDIRGWGWPVQRRAHQEAAAEHFEDNRSLPVAARIPVESITMNYLYPFDPVRWVSSAHFDLYELARLIRDDGRVSQAIREVAGEVARSVDEMVLTSVGTEEFGEFRPGSHGLYIVFPGGEREIGGEPAWAFFRWYHPFDQRTFQAAFGNYAWCRDGATPGNGLVENWFELLDFWLDTPADAGGMNFYRW